MCPHHMHVRGMAGCGKAAAHLPQPARSMCTSRVSACATAVKPPCGPKAERLLPW